jgi:hypothetical protein
VDKQAFWGSHPAANCRFRREFCDNGATVPGFFLDRCPIRLKRQQLPLFSPCRSALAGMKLFPNARPFAYGSIAAGVWICTQSEANLYRL